MKSNRRNFLKLSGLTGVGLRAGNIFKAFAGNEEKQMKQMELLSQEQQFNMCGFAAPKIETVRIGFIGLGNRGPGAVKRISKLDGVDIKGLCDIRPEKAEGAKKLLESGDAGLLIL